METVVSASAKLTKGLTGVDDESKAAGSAIAALGLSIKDFKALAPADQMESVAKALAGFKDGAEKTAVAMALFGKSGAELLPFLKELGAEGGRQVILTQAQIEKADAYADRQAKLRTELGLHAQSIATQLIPAYTDLTGALLDVSKGFIGVNKEADNLSQNGKIEVWGNRVADTFAFIADAASSSTIAFELAGESIAGLMARWTLMPKTNSGWAELSFDKSKGDAYMAQMKSIADSQAEAQNKIVASASTFRDALDSRRAASQKSIAEYAGSSRRDDVKPTLKFDGANNKTGKGAGGGEAKAQLSLDLSDIRTASDALTNTYGNAQKIMEAQRSAGLVDEREYYASKLAFLNLNSQAQEDALKQEIDRLGKEKLSGKDKLDNLRKITEAQAKLDKLREKSATSVEVMKIQEKAALDSIARAYVDAEEAAKSYLNTISRAAQEEIAGVGKGTKVREFNSGISGINEKFEGKRQDLQRDNRNGKFLGRADDFARELALLNSTQASEIAIYKAKYATLDEMQKDWSIGASEAMANYMSESHNIAKQSEKVWTDAFQGMEDALVNFTRTGKLDFRSLADSIISDLARIAIKQQISSMMGGSGGSGGSGLMGLFGSVIGAFSGTSSVASVASSMGGDSLDNMLKLTSNFAGRAVGGPVSAGGLYRVNERGPELLQVAGKQYLMMGNQSGSVNANKDSGNGSGGNTVNLTVNQNFSQGTSRATTMQAASDARRVLERSGRNL
jgi:lambda family phage tail tape measure protein